MKLIIDEPNWNLQVVERVISVIEIADFGVAQNSINKDIGDAKGDLIVFTGADTPVRLPVGGTNGQVLMVDSAETAGVKWGSLTAGASRLIVVEFDGGGATIVPDTCKVMTWLLSDFTASEWEILDLDAANSYFEVLVCVSDYSSYMPDPSDDIVGIHLGKTRPRLNNTLKNQSTALDWNDAVIEHPKEIRFLASGYLGALTFTGAGLNDMAHGASSRFILGSDINYKVEIDGTGSPNTFKWSDDGGSTWDASTVSITGADQLLNNGVYIRFAATTGHTSGNNWTWTARAITAKHVALTILGAVA